MIKKIVPVLLLGMVMTLAAHRAEAGLTYQATDLHTAGVTAGERWKYIYHVDGAFNQFEGFNLLYDANLYANLAFTSKTLSSDWLQGITDPLLGPPTADGQVTNTAQKDIANASADFEVAFDWTGISNPGSQPYELFDANFNVTPSRTTSTGASVPVPEPATLPLVLAGLLLILRNIKRRQLQLV